MSVYDPQAAIKAISNLKFWVESLEREVSLEHRDNDELCQVEGRLLHNLQQAIRRILVLEKDGWLLLKSDRKKSLPVERHRPLAKLREMQLFDDTHDPLDVGYMRAVDELRGWAAALPEGITEADGPTRHFVWLCAGCDECEPEDGSEPRLPCDGHSKNGAWMVLAGDYDDMARINAHREAELRRVHREGITGEWRACASDLDSAYWRPRTKRSEAERDLAALFTNEARWIERRTLSAWERIEPAVPPTTPQED